MIDTTEERTGSLPQRMLHALEAMVVLLSRLAPPPPPPVDIEPRQQEYAHDDDVQQIAGRVTAGNRKKFAVQNRGGAAIVLGPSNLTPASGIVVQAGELFSDDVKTWQGSWYFRTLADVVVVGDTIVVRDEIE